MPGESDRDKGDGAFKEDERTSTHESDRERNRDQRGDGRGEPTREREADDAANGGKKKFRLSKKALIIGGIVLAVMLVGAILYWLHARNFESTDDAYTTTHVHEISARVAGTVETVAVNDNQLVRAGDTLVTLDPRDFQVAADRARAQLQQRAAALEQTQANLDRAQIDYDRATSLYERDMKAISKADVDNATAALKAAQGAADAAKADQAAAQSALIDAELQLSYTNVVAPADGMIGKKTVETGARIQPGQTLMAVVENEVWVLGNYKETQLARVVVGQHVEVEIDAVPDRKFSAHVDSFQPGTGSAFALLPPDNATGNFTKIVQRVPVKIVFDDLGPYRNRVVPGLSCIPRIDLRTGPK